MVNLILSASVTPVEVVGDFETQSKKQGNEIEALRRAVMQQFDQYVKLNKKFRRKFWTSDLQY